jgi:hypothetical protein
VVPHLLRVSFFFFFFLIFANLNEVDVLEWADGCGLGDDLVVVAVLGANVLPLQVDLGLAIFPNIGLDGLVGRLARNDLLLALGGLKVGSGDVKVLADDAAIDQLVDRDAHGALVHVEDHPRAAVVVLERHTLVDRGVHLDVHIVTPLKLPQVRSRWAPAIRLEGLLEQGARSRAVAKRVRHRAVWGAGEKEKWLDRGRFFEPRQGLY